MTENGDESDAGRPPCCVVCGDRIEGREWHPVATRVDGEDEFHLALFCRESCREEWPED